jgi:hypothetical protein
VDPANEHSRFLGTVDNKLHAVTPQNITVNIQCAWLILTLFKDTVSEAKVIVAGRAVAQAVSRRLPITAARVRGQVRICGICGGQSGPGAGFLPVFPATHSSDCCTLFTIHHPGVIQ